MKFLSTKKLYQAMAKGSVSGFTVPAFNIRTLTFDLIRALLRAAKKEKVGAFIMEIAQSELMYTRQSLQEFSENCVKAVKAEKYKAPIFLQADHFKCLDEQCLNIREMEGLIKQAIMARFYNIDIDCSKMSLRGNINRTNTLIKYINDNAQNDIEISIGGEIGEIGGSNTTVLELEKFLSKVKGISKVAVQTGTSHAKGGQINWELLEQLNNKAKEHGLAGVVQHGASTLPEGELAQLPRVGVCEVHLATGIMDTILESQHFPEELGDRINSKHDLGVFKEDILNIPQTTIDKIAEEVEAEFVNFFKLLNVIGSLDLVEKLY